MNSEGQADSFQTKVASVADHCWRRLSAGVVALLVVVLAQSFFSIGGVDSQYLVYTFGALTVAVGAQCLVFWARSGRGFGMSGLTALFLPWLAVLFLSAVFFSEMPWRARYHFCEALLPVMAFFAASHAVRTKRARWWLIASVAMLTLLSGLAEFLQPEAERVVEQIGGGSFGESVRTIFGAFGHPAGIGAALLLVFFPMAALAFSARFHSWARLFGVYTAVLILAGIAATRHFGVYLGFFAGSALVVSLLIKNKKIRYSLFVAIVVVAGATIFHLPKNIGVLKTAPVSVELQEKFSAEELGSGTKYLLPHAALEMFKENPIVGVGGGCFSTEFEKYRTPQWRTTPTTAGSLYLTVLAEYGLLGLLALVVPVGAFAFIAVRACQKMPWYADTESARTRRKMGVLDFGALPEERLALAVVLGGLLGVSVLFAVDYPRTIPGISIACAAFGGIAAFLASGEWRHEVVCEGRRRHLLLPCAFALPVVLFFFFLPVFRAESEFQKGHALLRPFFIDPDSGAVDAKNPDFRALPLAESHLRSALRKAPDHGDAWNMLSKKYILDCQRDPAATETYGKYLAETTARALETSPSVSDFYRMRAAAEMVSGNFDAVKENLRKADGLAPHNVPGLLESVEIYRAFPAGIDDAAAVLDRVVALAPHSNYAQRIRALILLGENRELGGAKSDDEIDASHRAIPEF